MRKLCFFLITIFCIFSVYSEAKVRIKGYDRFIEIDDKIEDLLAYLGDPNEISCTPFEGYHNLDMLCYEYNDFRLYSYRAVKSVYMIYVDNQAFDILIQNNTITYGEQKSQIDKKFGEGMFLSKNNKGYDVYSYSFADPLELYLLYDENNKLYGMMLNH